MDAMDLKQLACAVAVAEERNFTRAAARCHIVQSALSHQIARLEAELGVALFERSSRRVSLSAAGEAFLPAARQVLDGVRQVREVVAAASGEVRGTLTVGSLSALANVDPVEWLARFHQCHPGVAARLYTGSSGDLLDHVRDGSCDVAFVGVSVDAGLGRVNSLSLCREQLVALLPPGHRLGDEPGLSLRHLSAEPQVDYAGGSAARCQTDEAFLRSGVERRVSFEVGSLDWITRIVRRGLAIALVPEACAAQLDGVISRPIVDAPCRAVHMVWSRSPSPAAQAFVALFRDGFVPAPQN